MKIIRYFILLCLTVVLSALLFFIFFEIMLRIKEPEHFVIKQPAEGPAVTESDPVLGWKNKPGMYTEWPKRWANGREIKLTIWPGGQRATGTRRIEKEDRIIVVGCSYAQGFAVSDDETFAWKLQDRFPEIEFLNYGTGAYGTYQSLLLLESYLNTHPPPELVIYGFADFHPERNTAPVDWQRLLTKKSHPWYVRIPYCTIDHNNNIVRHPPEGYLAWSLSKYSIAIDYLQLKLLKLFTMNRYFQQQAVTERLLLEMANLCDTKGTILVVCFLCAEETCFKSYSNFLSENKIEFINCIPPKRLNLNMKVTNEGHPSPELHSYWADCIGKYIERRKSGLLK